VILATTLVGSIIALAPIVGLLGLGAVA